MGILYKVVAVVKPINVFETRATYSSNELINEIFNQGHYCYALSFSRLLRSGLHYEEQVVPLIRSIQMAHRDKRVEDPTHLHVAFRNFFKLDEHRSYIQPENIGASDFESLLFVRFKPKDSVPHTFSLLKSRESVVRYALFDSNDQSLEPYYKKTVDEVRCVLIDACRYYREIENCPVESIEKVSYTPRKGSKFLTDKVG